MARIRTIKPEFWTDERLTECSLSARLLFIGLLNFADDNGNLVKSAKRIKMQVFPADAIDCLPLLDELITHGLLIEYSVSEEKYLHIKGFTKHQVISRPSGTKIPQPPLHESSVSPQVPLGDGREGKGKGKEEDLKKYKFCGKVVRLNETDYQNFKTIYFAIPDFDAELSSADAYYSGHPEKAWFMALSGWLNKSHQEMLRRNPKAAQPKSTAPPNPQKQVELLLWKKGLGIFITSQEQDFLNAYEKQHGTIELKENRA